MSHRTTEQLAIGREVKRDPLHRRCVAHRLDLVGGRGIRVEVEPVPPRDGEGRTAGRAAVGVPLRRAGRFEEGQSDAPSRENVAQFRHETRDRPFTNREIRTQFPARESRDLPATAHRAGRQRPQ